MTNYPTSGVEALLAAKQIEDFYTSPLTQAAFDIDGLVGNDRHSSRTRLADMRIKPYVRDCDVVLNRQQLSMVDGASLDFIADELELYGDLIADRHEGDTRRLFLARCMGANIVFGDFRGTKEIPSFHDIPNATDFGVLDSEHGKFTDDTATVMITRYNGPCIHPGKKIEEHYPGNTDGLAGRFVKAASGKRGFVGMVIKPGVMSVGQEVTFTPLPRP